MEIFNILPIETLRGMLNNAKLKMRSRTGFIVGKLKRLQQQGVPYETAMSNPEIIELLKQLQTTREALHVITQIIQEKS